MIDSNFEEFWTDLNKQLFVPSAGILPAELTGYMYRGLPNAAYELTTSVQRLNLVVRRLEGGRPITTDEDRRLELQYRERRLIDSFRKYARTFLPFGTTDWDVMVLGQHYRLPTRLLDWTASPYVALFFATERLSYDNNGEEPDAVVWCVSHPATLAICDQTLLKRLKDARKGTADVEFMNAFHSIEDFDAEPYKEPSLLWFEPHSIDQRIVNQNALFSLMQGVSTRVDHWLSSHANVAWRVSIPGEVKALLRRRLNLLNVTDRTLFPGLEGISRWQRAHYSD